MIESINDLAGLIVDTLAVEGELGEPVEYGLVTSGTDLIALFKTECAKIRVYLGQTASSVLGLSSEYSRLLSRYRGLPSEEERPDILVVVEKDDEHRLVLVQMRRLTDGRYVGDSIYKLFGYIYDFGGPSSLAASVRGILIVPPGIVMSAQASSNGAPADLSVVVASADDRTGLARALRDAMSM